MKEERLAKINELIKRELGRIIQREFDHSPQQLISLTEVATSEDLLSSRVRVSIWPDASRKAIFRNLSRATALFQHFLNKRLAMRPVPKITFELDMRMVEAGRVEELLEEVKNKEKAT